MMHTQHKINFCRIFFVLSIDRMGEREKAHYDHYNLCSTFT